LFLNDAWSLNLDLVQSLQALPSVASLPQILTLQSNLKQYLRFKLHPTHNSFEPLALGPYGGQLKNFSLLESGFSHSFAIAAWLRIIPPLRNPLPHLIFELQRPFTFNFDEGTQNTLLRLYLNNSRLELVDFNWKVCRMCKSSAFRIAQSQFSVTVADGLWHHVAVTVSTDLQKKPSSRDDPDLIFLFGTE
jgi:hypothetical protein